MKKYRLNKNQKLFLIEYFFLNIYLWYRYAFRYNSTLTSPTYYDTPTIWKIGKYIIIVVFLGMYVVLNGFKIKSSYKKLTILLMAVSIIIFVKAVIVKDIEFFAKWVLMIWAAYPMLTIRMTDGFQVRFLQINKVIFIFHVVYSAVQCGLYILQGRLPALAYRGGMVRFGGGYDDPNAFAIYLMLPIAYILYNIIKEHGKTKDYILLAICIVLLIMTISFAGFLALGIVGILFLKKYCKKKRMFNLVCLALMCAVIGAVTFEDTIISILGAKQESASQHLGMLIPYIEDTAADVYAFGTRKFYFSENFYNQILNYFGMLFFVAYVGFKIWIIKMAYRASRTSEDKYSYIAFVYITSFSVAQIGIPYTTVFPVNFLYWCCVFFVCRVLIKNRREKLFNRNNVVIDRYE